MTRLAWLPASLRRLREGRVLASILAALVLVTAFAFGIAPRLLERVADRAFEDSVAAAPIDRRDLALTQQGRIAPAGSVPVGPVDTTGRALEGRLPASVQALISDRVYVVDSARWIVTSKVAALAMLNFRIQEGAESHVRLVEGRMPTGQTRTIEPPAAADGTVTSPPVTVFEGILSTTTADTMGVSVGQTMTLSPDPTDFRNRGVGNRGAGVPMALDVVGLYEPLDANDPYWYNEPALVRPRIHYVSDNYVYNEASALLAADAYPALMNATERTNLPFSYAWRFGIEPARLRAAGSDQLEADLRRIESTFHPGSTTGDGVVLQSSLQQFVGDFAGSWRSALAVLAVVALGPAVIAGAALALIALESARRRRAAVGIWLDRGASRAQVGASVLAEALLIALPSAVLAALLASLAVPSGSPGSTAVITLIVVGATVVLVLAAEARSTLRGSLVALEARDVSIVRPPSPRRLMLEAFVVAIAIGGAYLLRERGVRGTSSTGSLTAADPFIAAVPALVGVAAGVVALRAVAVPLHGLAAVAALRRDLVPTLGLRRATRVGGEGTVLVVLLAIAAIAAFSSAILVQLERSADAIAGQEVGAPYRISAPVGALPTNLDVVGLPGVVGSARAYEATVPLTRTGPTANLLALDAQAYADVVTATGADQGLPVDFLGPAVQPLPAIVSSSAATATTGIEPGSVFRLTFGAANITFRAIEVRTTFPSLDLDVPFVVVSREQLVAVQPKSRFDATSIFLRAPDNAGPAIRAALAARAPSAALASHAERTAAIGGAPLVGAVKAGVEAAVAGAAIYAALAVAAALALAGEARAIEAAHLRTFGLSRRQILALVLVEHGPIVVLAFAGGVALGFGLFVALRSGLGLGGILGSALDVPVQFDFGQVAVVLVGSGLFAGVGVVLGTYLQRRAMLADAIRRGM